MSSSFMIVAPSLEMVEYVDSTYEVQPARDLASLATSLDAGRGLPHRNAFFGRMSANTLEEQTTVLLKDNVSRVPYDRWDFSYIDSIEEAVGAPRFGIFMDDVSKFDPRSFNIMPAEAVYTDPQQRMLLLHSSKVLSGVPEKEVGSYVSFVSSDYSTLASAHDVPVNAFSFSGTASSVASGRISFCTKEVSLRQTGGARRWTLRLTATPEGKPAGCCFCTVRRAPGTSCWLERRRITAGHAAL